MINANAPLHNPVYKDVFPSLFSHSRVSEGMNLRVLPSEKVQLYLLFYKPSCDDPLLNRLVAFFDAPFCHVEIAIPKRVGDEPWDRIMMASSIYQNQTVFFKQKTYGRQGYISFAIEISVAQLYKIKSFCKHHTERMTPFSLGAMYAAYLPFQIVETDATFCSKHVTQALQYASVSIADNINPSLTTPSNLYKRLIRANSGAAAILQVMPSRMMNAQLKSKYSYMITNADSSSSSNTNDPDDNNNNHHANSTNDSGGGCDIFELTSSAYTDVDKAGGGGNHHRAADQGNRNHYYYYDQNKQQQHHHHHHHKNQKGQPTRGGTAIDDDGMILSLACGRNVIHNNNNTNNKPRHQQQQHREISSGNATEEVATTTTTTIDFFVGAKNVSTDAQNAAARHQRQFFSLLPKAARGRDPNIFIFPAIKDGNLQGA